MSTGLSIDLILIECEGEKNWGLWRIVGRFLVLIVRIVLLLFRNSGLGMKNL